MFPNDRKRFFVVYGHFLYISTSNEYNEGGKQHLFTVNSWSSQIKVRRGELNLRKKLIVSILIAVIFTLVVVGPAAYYTIKTHELEKTPSSKSSSSRPAVKVLDSTGTGSAVSGAYVPKTSSQTLSELEKQQVTVTDKVASQISFTNGTAGAEGTWMVENPASNQVIEQCEVYLNDNLIAKSAPINPGQHIESIKLLQDISAGDYSVTAYLNYFAADSKTYIGKAGYQIKLKIE